MNKLVVLLALLVACKEKEQKPAAAPLPAPAPAAVAPKLPAIDAAPAPPEPELATRKELPDSCQAWRKQLEKIKDCAPLRRRLESMRRGYAALDKTWGQMELADRKQLDADCTNNANDIANAARAECPELMR